VLDSNWTVAKPLLSVCNLSLNAQWVITSHCDSGLHRYTSDSSSCESSRQHSDRAYCAQLVSYMKTQDQKNGGGAHPLCMHVYGAWDYLTWCQIHACTPSCPPQRVRCRLCRRSAFWHRRHCTPLSTGFPNHDIRPCFGEEGIFRVPVYLGTYRCNQRPTKHRMLRLQLDPGIGQRMIKHDGISSISIPEGPRTNNQPLGS
jgi:hypothetical protein